MFPVIQKNVSRERGIRIWTPGCASGEETYSVAIALLEFLGDKAGQIPIQFFGTDVSEPSVTKARNGLYPENIQGDVSPERLRRFFTKGENGYRVSKIIRDMCIFAQHNVVNDPPFSRMDLICCRNLLIYLEPVLQNKVISLFHYALGPSGFLVLGSSEGLGEQRDLSRWKTAHIRFFQERAGAARQSGAIFRRCPDTNAGTMDSPVSREAAGFQLELCGGAEGIRPAIAYAIRAGDGIRE